MKPRTKQRRRRANTFERFMSVCAGTFRAAGWDPRGALNSTAVKVWLDGHMYEAGLILNCEWVVIGGDAVVSRGDLTAEDDFDLEALAQRFVQIIRDDAERRAAARLAEVLS